MILVFPRLVFLLATIAVQRIAAVATLPLLSDTDIRQTVQGL